MPLPLRTPTVQSFKDSRMSVLQTQLNPRSAEFAANATAMQAVVDDLRAHLERVAQGGGEAARASTPPVANCCRESA